MTPRKDEWLARETLREGVANLHHGGVRSAINIVLSMVVFVVIFGTEVSATQRVVDRQRALIDAGGYVLKISPSSTDGALLASPACEALQSQGGVTASGAVLSSDLYRFSNVDSRQIRLTRVTAGLLESLAVHITGPSGAVLMDESAAEEFGLTIGSSLAIAGFEGYSVSGMARSLVRSSVLERSLLVTDLPIGEATDCFVEVAPHMYEQMRAGELLALANLSASTSVVSELVPRGSGLTPRQEFEQRITRYGWLIGAMVVAGIYLVGFQFRRRERVLYVATGSSTRSAALIAASEGVLNILLAALLVLSLLPLSAGVKSFTRPSVRYGLHAMFSCICLSALLVAIIASLPTRRRHVLEALKDAS